MMITGCSSYVSRDEMKKALQQRDEVLVKVVAALKELQEKTGVRKDAEKGKK